MEAAIHLHQFAKVPSRLAPFPVCSPLPHPAPQSFRQHPPPQRLWMNGHSILTCKVFSCQRWPKSFPYLPGVFLAHQTQHFQPKLFRLAPPRFPSDTPMLQPLRTFFLISPPDPLCLSVAQSKNLRCVDQVQGFFFNSRQHSQPFQFLAAHPCPIQSDLP